MKRMNESILLLFLFLWVAGGCTQTEVEERPVPSHALKDVEAVFNLHVLANQVPLTRSAGEDGVAGDTIPTRSSSDLDAGRDNNIASLWIGQYDAKGALLYHYYNGSMTGNKINVKLKQNQSADDSKSHVWFVANSGDLGEIATETKLKQHVLAYSSTATGLPESGLCGMSGMWEGVVKEDGGAKEISVDLTRLLAKITFTYTISETPNSFSFDIDSIMLKSVPDRLQIDTAKTQLADVIYQTYKETDFTSSNSDGKVTKYWYLPENMAGTGLTVDSEKKKTGKGVSNATYIEMAGTAVQGGVTYKDVVFRFYPGKDHKNNYDIMRNAHYNMEVTLVGIDVTDERITVGEIPPITVVGENMPAEKGGTKEVQITARPGQEWMFNLKDWLTATIDGKDAGTGAQISHQGPAKVTFQSTEANPKAESRSVVFPVAIGGTTQEITITQEGSTLAIGENISLGEAVGSEGVSSFTATKGVKWQIDRAEDWWNWVESNPVTSGTEATGSEQPLNIKAISSNPSKDPRRGTITVKAGESVTSDYPDLKKNITVTQAGSTVTGSAQTVAAEAAEGLTASFSATAGLSWAANVTDGSWITLATTGGQTTGADQTLTYKVTVNPTSSERSDAITVQAGDESTGPTGTITVKQEASVLTASGSKPTLEATADDSGTLTYAATKGLPLSIIAPEWLTLVGGTPETTTGSEQTIEYKTKSLNLKSVDKTGNILVKAGEIKQDVAVTQSGSTFTVSETELSFEKAGGSKTVTVNGTKGLPWTVTPSEVNSGITTDIESTNANGEDQALTFTASENTGVSRSVTFIVAVTDGDHSKSVEVKQEGESSNTITIDQAIADAYRSAQSDLKKYPPFNYDEGEVSGTLGIDYKGKSSTATISTPYTIEVEKTQSKDTYIYNTKAAKEYCEKLVENEVWRLPTLIELFAIWTKCKGSNKDATDDEAASRAFGAKFISYYYWSSSVCNGGSGNRCVLGFGSGNFGWNGTSSSYYVRCVRDN